MVRRKYIIIKWGRWGRWYGYILYSIGGETFFFFSEKNKTFTCYIYKLGVFMYPIHPELPHFTFVLEIYEILLNIKNPLRTIE